MTFARFIFDACPPVGPATDKLNVVILYERLAYVGRATATYMHLTEGVAGEFSSDYRLWRIDLALEPAFAAEAERDLADADVIIMAIDGRQRCPAAFQRWRTGAGHEGGPGPHAVIALMMASDDPEPAAESWSGLLHDAATQIHPEVFVCEGAKDRW